MVSARPPGTPMLSPIFTKSSVGRVRSIMSSAVRPGLAPTLASSPSRMAYLRLAKTMVVTSRFSRAWVHSPWIVYIAEPSASRVTTRRPGQATAAPVASGMPWPMAPPVMAIQSCGAASCVSG